MTPLAYTIDQLKELGGPGRDKAYQEIREGKLRAVKYGRRTRVLAVDFQSYLASLPAIEPRVAEREGGDHYGFMLLYGRGAHRAADALGNGADGSFCGSTFEPLTVVCDSAVAQNLTAVAQNLTISGSKIEPELKEINLQNRTQDSLFGEGQLPEQPPFDFDAWFEQEWWPQYPRKVEKAAAKKLAKTTIEGRRSDGFKATPDQLMAGVMRYAALMMGKDEQYIKHPTTWLNKACWLDEHGGRASPSSASTKAVWAAGEALAARGRRVAG